ncbi:MAG: hypothetical protein MJE66_13740, partial [Proteobacteria bacterium]|nr:hypothetical protein [Pseudomonadota bacterium]
DDVLPALVAQYTSELWVEFVEGERIRPGEPGTAAAVARAFAVLYRADARQVPETETGVHAELCRDLEFLREAGVLDRRLHHRVLAGAERLRPEKIWVGYDYMDAIVPNLLRRPDGRVCIIDFESVETDRPLGSGVAKAFIRWLEPEREPFLEALQREGVPDFLPALPFAELAFLASWMKRAVIRRRWKHVGPERFVRFADP